MIAIILTVLLSSVPTITPISTPTAVVVFEDAELKEARQAYQAGDFQRAVTILKAYVEKKPKSFDGYFQLGLSHRALKQFPEAIAALEKSVQLKPKSNLAQFELGQTYIDVKNYESAVKQYRWLEKKDKLMASEFRLYFPTEIAKQFQLPPSIFEQNQADIEAAKPLYPMSINLKPEILHRERAKYTEEARNNKINGTVVLRLIYSKEGKVIIVAVTRGLPYGLTEACIEAAKKIRFKPALQTGQPVSVIGTVEFGFSIY
ncbi:MAG: TonB family protein [Blastocatellia bacterium]